MQRFRSEGYDVIVGALDLAMQAWRTVPSARDRITDAVAAVGWLRELERENRWLRSIILEHIGTDPENIGKGRPPTPEEESAEEDFYRRVAERRKQMGCLSTSYRYGLR